MRRIPAVLAIVLVLALVAVGCGADGGTGEESNGAPEPAQGASTPLPTETFEAFDGSQTSFAEHEGRPLVVNFWASWCPPCIAEMPAIESVHQDLKDEVGFIGVNTRDERDAAERLVEETGVTYELASDPDGSLAQAFGLFGMPSTYFASPDGHIVHSHTGSLTEEQLRDLIREHLEP